MQMKINTVFLCTQNTFAPTSTWSFNWKKILSFFIRFYLIKLIMNVWCKASHQVIGEKHLEVTVNCWWRFRWRIRLISSPLPTAPEVPLCETRNSAFPILQHGICSFFKSSSLVFLLFSSKQVTWDTNFKYNLLVLSVKQFLLWHKFEISKPVANHMKWLRFRFYSNFQHVFGHRNQHLRCAILLAQSEGFKPIRGNFTIFPLKLRSLCVVALI